MVTKSTIDDFLSQKKIAVLGVSRDGKKFGNVIFRDMKKKGYQVFPINPNTDNVEGEKCYPNLSSLPEKVDGVIVNVPPAVTKEVVAEAASIGIKRIWLQQGSESESAIQLCRENQLQFIHGECILMFAEPVGFGHRVHRWIWKILGKLPE